MERTTSSSNGWHRVQPLLLAARGAVLSTLGIATGWVLYSHPDWLELAKDGEPSGVFLLIGCAVWALIVVVHRWVIVGAFAALALLGAMFNVAAGVRDPRILFWLFGMGVGLAALAAWKRRNAERVRVILGGWLEGIEGADRDRAEKRATQ